MLNLFCKSYQNRLKNNNKTGWFTPVQMGVTLSSLLAFIASGVWLVYEFIVVRDYKSINYSIGFFAISLLCFLIVTSVCDKKRTKKYYTNPKDCEYRKTSMIEALKEFSFCKSCCEDSEKCTFSREGIRSIIDELIQMYQESLNQRIAREQGLMKVMVAPITILIMILAGVFSVGDAEVRNKVITGVLCALFLWLLVCLLLAVLLWADIPPTKGNYRYMIKELRNFKMLIIAEEMLLMDEEKQALKELIRKIYPIIRQKN